MRSCLRCGQPIGPMVRSDATTCSTRCRVALHRQRATVPAEVRKLDRWVRWNARKVPLRADGAGAASSTDQATWAPYAKASGSSVGEGVGFVLDGDGIVCVDLDHCIEQGALTADGVALMAGCPATWVEVSPSGTGLHVWGRADVSGRSTGEAGRCEVYGWGRYITVTGERWKGSTAKLADLTDWIAGLP